MLVIDASAVVDLLLEQPVNDRLRVRVAVADELHAPHLIDLEVLSVVRRLCAAGKLSGDAAGVALQHFGLLPISRYPHEPLRSRIWALRHELTVNDASYVALAEALQLPLITSDGRMARSHGHHATVESYDRS